MSTDAKKQLGRTKQCAKCPWRKKSNPRKIPNGYDVRAHKQLRQTIAEPGTFGRINSMACHESEVGEEVHCIGWLCHQLGPGNNISLRLKMMRYDLSKVELVGDQHQRFEDTLPAGASCGL